MKVVGDQGYYGRRITPTEAEKLIQSALPKWLHTWGDEREDIVQEVRCAVLMNVDALDNSKSAPATIIYRLTRQVLYDLFEQRPHINNKRGGRDIPAHQVSLGRRVEMLPIGYLSDTDTARYETYQQDEPSVECVALEAVERAAGREAALCVA